MLNLKSLKWTWDRKDLYQSLVVLLPLGVEGLGLLAKRVWVEWSWVCLEKRRWRLILIRLEAGSERIEIVALRIIALGVKLVGGSLNQGWLVVLLLIFVVSLSLELLILWSIVLMLALIVIVRRLRKLRILLLVLLVTISILLLLVILLLPLPIIALRMRVL
jgi:hypothetical protein